MGSRSRLPLTGFAVTMLVACGVDVVGVAADDSTSIDASAPTGPAQGDGSSPDSSGSSASSSSGSGGSGGSTSTSTSTSSTTSSGSTCTPTTEICNGKDDNCNLKVDEGCPSGVSLGAPTSTSPVFGNASGGSSPYDDTCPAGEALIGVAVVTSTYLRQIKGICGKLTIVDDALTVTAGATLGNHGVTPGTADKVTCPTNQVMVGAQGKGGLDVDQLTLRCATVTLAGSIGSYTVDVGTSITTAGPVGGPNGSTITPYTCPNKGIVNRLAGATGDGLDNVKWFCATATVTLRD